MSASLSRRGNMDVKNTRSRWPPRVRGHGRAHTKGTRKLQPAESAVSGNQPLHACRYGFNLVRSSFSSLRSSGRRPTNQAGSRSYIECRYRSATGERERTRWDGSKFACIACVFLGLSDPAHTVWLLAWHGRRRCRI
jgi:hypothetical protein